MKGWGSIVCDWLGAGLLTGVLLISLAGCGPSFTFGTPPKVDQLHQLRRGASTSSDVRSILGEPRGKGETRLPVGHRTLWLYDSGELDGLRTRIRYLIIFLDGETYDGYLWFDINSNFEQPHAS
jgi:hypothetical protein